MPETVHRPTALSWCADCQKFTAQHPLDHLDDVHPPEFPDGSRALPERIEVAA